MKCYLVAMFMALTLATNLNAQTTFNTEFNTSDGFVTGGTGDVVVGNGLITFSGGQQQQGFLGAAYNNGPAAYLFINGDRIATVESDWLGVLADSLASVWVSIARNSGLAAGKSY